MKKTISGIRGVVGDDLGIQDVMTFCSNFAGIAGDRCVTGMDTRDSSDLLMRAAHAGLMSKGMDVYSLGMVPTPVVFREARKIGAGVMITSSHNPPEWNGLKFVLNGRGINESELPHITYGHSHTVSKDHSGTGGDIATNPGTASSHTTSYVDDAASVIGSIGGKPRIIADVGGGAALHIVQQMYEKIGCKISIVNAARGSRSPDPTTDPLSKLVQSSPRCDIGFAFDLDGDRLVVVKDGKKQSPDVTLGLGIAGAIDRGCKKFVLSMDTSLGVEKIIKSGSGTATRTKVGEANVVDEMIKSKAQAGGEGSSGGFILSEFNYCRDGILAGGMIAGMLQKNNGTRLKETLDVLGAYHIMRTKVQADPALHGAMVERAQKWMKSECSEVQEIDGTRGVIDEDSWVLVRRSNTEDAVRVSAESDSPLKCRSLVAKINSAMRDGA